MSECRTLQKRPAAPTLRPARIAFLQRKCACGQHTVGGAKCEACSRKKQSLQRYTASHDEHADVPEIVHDVLRSPGRPLDSTTRSFMESRFHHDFSRVRIHADAKAGESAQAVNALAYTVGSDVVFGSHQHTPGSSTGRELLAHELAHVMQQEHVRPGTAPTRISEPSDAGEANAKQVSRSALTGEGHAQEVSKASSPMLSRSVIPKLVHCTANSDGAPAAPVTELTTLVDRAELMARMTAILLRLDAILTRAGMRPDTSEVDMDFSDRFGTPPAVNGGFMNRLTGAVKPTLDLALSEELELTAGRFEMIANQFGGGFVHYLCMSTASSFGGCNVAACTRHAFACPGVNAIFLCPGFWGGGDTSSGLLIHEAAHMIWGRIDHGAQGSGGNFRHAECYATLVADLFGFLPGEPECFIP